MGNKTYGKNRAEIASNTAHQLSDGTDHSIVNAITTFAKTLLDDVTAAAMRTTLGAAASGSNADITALTALTNITPGANLTITQNSVVPFTSVESGAVVDTLKLNAGNAEFAGNLVMASGQGIDFSATGDAGGMTSELLDDYEEGTWTPIITFGGASVGITYNTQTGTYTRIGRVVTVACIITLSAKGSSSGPANIASLPFTSTSTFAGALGRIDDISFSAQMTAYANSGSTAMRIYQYTTAGLQANITESNFSDTSRIVMTASYEA